jgi:hypothetical protein
MAWLTGWTYRKSHVINYAVGAGTNYQVKIVAHYGTGTDNASNVYLNSHARSDFGDIRFTSSDQTTLLDYWMESKTDNNNAVFWVEVSDNLSAANVTIYIYYGNATATTTSNGVNTFLKFDDFETTTTNGDRWYAAGANDGSGGSTVYYVGDHLDVSTESTSNTSAGGRTGLLKTKEWRPSIGQTTYYVLGIGEIHYLLSSATSIAVDFDYYIDTLTASASYWDSFVFVVFKLSDSTYWMVRLKDVYGSGYQFRSNIILTAATTGLSISSSNTTVLTGDSLSTWYSKSIKSLNYSSLMITDAYIGVSGGCDNNTGYGSALAYFDNLRLRKYVSPEPSHGSWGSEEKRRAPASIIPLMRGMDLLQISKCFPKLKPRLVT